MSVFTVSMAPAKRSSTNSSLSARPRTSGNPIDASPRNAIEVKHPRWFLLGRFASGLLSIDLGTESRGPFRISPAGPPMTAAPEQTRSRYQAHGGAVTEWSDWYAEASRRAAEDRACVAERQREADRQWEAWYRATQLDPGDSDTGHSDPGPAGAVTGHSRLGRGLRGAAGFAVLLACLVVPWLLPWPSVTDSTVAADPLHDHVSADRRPEAGTSAARPDANVVRRLREATQTLASEYDVPVSPKALAAVRTQPGPYRKLGRLKIPSLSLSVSYGEGVSADILERGPGHWPGTPMPGSVGNSVVSGHRNTHTRPFKELDELKPGDTIITSYEDRSPVTFQVVQTTIVPQAHYRDFVLRQPTEPNARELTLFACHPEGNPVFRIVVQARAQR